MADALFAMLGKDAPPDQISLGCMVLPTPYQYGERDGREGASIFSTTAVARPIGADEERESVSMQVYLRMNAAPSIPARQGGRGIRFSMAPCKETINGHPFNRWTSRVEPVQDRCAGIHGDAAMSDPRRIEHAGPTEHAGSPAASATHDTRPCAPAEPSTRCA
ncbi:hypothetical protein EIB72_28150 [Burkholderia ambifaria]|uniref:hypothetical protein n=1 Tax=Burkholderia ambifaria TaxID=152480 RepID=UPI0013FD15B3|nr:hypothetical protein [Burkholderia ambifaria]NHL70257.1 hypothetical protein [Burkholderia ambifaria]